MPFTWETVNFWAKRTTKLFLVRYLLLGDVYLELEVILVGFWLELLDSHFFNSDFTLDATFFAHRLITQIELGVRDTV